nr:hypothetical protein [Streptomyces sp. V2]
MEQAGRGRGGEQCADREGPGGLARQGDIARVAVERGDVVPGPAQGCGLVLEAEVRRSLPGMTQVGEVQPAQGAQPVVGGDDDRAGEPGERLAVAVRGCSKPPP